MMAVLRRIDTYEEVCMSVREKESRGRVGFSEEDFTVTNILQTKKNWM